MTTGSGHASILIKILWKTNGFERRGESGWIGDGKIFDFNSNPSENYGNGFERRGGSRVAGNGKNFDID